MEVFFLGGMIFLAVLAFWYLSPQVNMSDKERAEADRKAFVDELRRRHGERVNARNWYNR